MLAHTATQPATPAPRPCHATQRVTRHNTYAVRVRGDGMRDCNLFNGDVIIIRRFQNGVQETATAEINRQPVALERLSINHHGLQLMFANSARPSVFLHNRDIEVLSLVMGIEHHATEH